MKTCSMCKHTLPLAAFKHHVHHKDGLQSQCIACQKKYRRRHYLKNRQKYIDKAAVNAAKFKAKFLAYKATLTCQNCGEADSACLDFHHTAGKELPIALMVLKCSQRRLDSELKKCIPLCANCHRKLHAYGTLPNLSPRLVDRRA